PYDHRHEKRDLDEPPHHLRGRPRHLSDRDWILSNVKNARPSAARTSAKASERAERHRADRATRHARMRTKKAQALRRAPFPGAPFRLRSHARDRSRPASAGARWISKRA